MYNAGEILRCTISEKRGNYYLVKISGDKSAMLKSDLELKNGDSRDVCFVCMHEGQILLRELSVMPSQQLASRLEEKSLEREHELKTSEMEPLPVRLIDFFYRSGTIDNNLKNSLSSRAMADDFQTICEILKELQSINTLSQADAESLEQGVSLILDGTITFEQFSVGYYDQLTTGITLVESLTARGWL